MKVYQIPCDAKKRKPESPITKDIFKSQVIGRARYVLSYVNARALTVTLKKNRWSSTITNFDEPLRWIDFLNKIAAKQDCRDFAGDLMM